MAGGTWTAETTTSPGTRPGAYINFQAVAESAIRAGNRGVVAVAGISTWGPSETIKEILTEQEAIDWFSNTDDANANLYRMIRQAFIGGANKVLAFRMVGATPVLATRTLVDTTGSPVNVIRIDAKYYGTYGNNFKLTIADDATDTTKTSIKLYNGTSLLATWITTVNHGAAGFVDNVISIINDDTNNIWVDAVKIADGNNDLADITTQSLASGANGDAIVQADYDAAESAFELQDWNVIAFETVTGSIQIDIAAWITTLRDNQGKKVMAVVGSDTGDSASTIATDAQTLNNKGVVYVGPGAIVPDADGDLVTYNGAQMTSRVAAMIASENIGGSITHDVVTLATDVETRFTDANIRTMLEAGVCVLSWNTRAVVIERGVTTFYSPGTEPASFLKIAVVATCDAIANAIQQAAEDKYIGKIPNDEVGQRALISDISDFLSSLVTSRAIRSDFTAIIDPDYDSTGDEVFIKIGITPIDAMEKLFLTIEVS